LKIMFTFFSTKMSPLQGLKKCDRLFIAYIMLSLHRLENYASLLFYQNVALTGLGKCGEYFFENIMSLLLGLENHVHLFGLHHTTL